MKDPAFLFYSSDFLSGISDLTMEERGQYITLLCVQHQKYSLNEKTIRLLVGNVSVDVMNKFSKDENGNFYNKRLREESEKRNKFTESRRNNGSLGGRPSKNKQPKEEANKNHMDNHMGNENEDVNKNIIDNKNNTIYAELSISEFWLENVSMQSTLKLTVNEVKLFLKKYNDMINVQFEFKNNKTEYCSHFINWLNKQSKPIKKNNLPAHNPLRS